jgi:hypothetical protein
MDEKPRIVAYKSPMPSTVAAEGDPASSWLRLIAKTLIVRPHNQGALQVQWGAFFQARQRYTAAGTAPPI